MRFTRLVLFNWRNFRRVDVALRARCFLVGPNASGKSNFLDALRFLHDLVSVGGGLQGALQSRGGVSSIRCLAARQQPDIGIEVGIGAADPPERPTWRYRLSIGQDERQAAVVREEEVWHHDDRLLTRPGDPDRADPERLRQTSLEQTTENRPFREIASFFASIRYLHIVPQIVRDPARHAGHVLDPYGGDFLDQIVSTPARTARRRLQLIRKALQVAVPQLRDLRVEKDRRGVPHLKGLYEHWRPKAGWQTEERFSDGTLRLLGLLWSLLDAEGPLLLEEPELSLHAAVVRQIPTLFQRAQRSRPRQIIVSTHHAELLSDEGIGGEEVVMLIPAREGTQAVLASSDRQVRALLENGVSVGEAVLPRTQPHDAQQLGLFGE